MFLKSIFKRNPEFEPLVIGSPFSPIAKLNNDLQCLIISASLRGCDVSQHNGKIYIVDRKGELDDVMEHFCKNNGWEFLKNI